MGMVLVGLCVVGAYFLGILTTAAAVNGRLARVLVGRRRQVVLDWDPVEFTYVASVREQAPQAHPHCLAEVADKDAYLALTKALTAAGATDARWRDARLPGASAPRGRAWFDVGGLR